MERPTVKTKKFKVADSYLALIHQFPLDPIRNDDEYGAATSVMEQLAVRGEDDLDDGERDYLDALDEFVSAYDRIHVDLDDNSTPLERLKYILAQSETSPAAMKQILGCSQSLVSMIVNGDRELSKENIRVLAAHFCLDAGYFL